MHELEVRLVDGDEMNFDKPFLPFKEKNVCEEFFTI